jgi:hypothetical protein
MGDRLKLQYRHTRKTGLSLNDSFVYTECTFVNTSMIHEDLGINTAKSEIRKCGEKWKI